MIAGLPYARNAKKAKKLGCHDRGTPIICAQLKKKQPQPPPRAHNTEKQPPPPPARVTKRDNTTYLI